MPPTPSDHATPGGDALRRLAVLVVKSRVGLGSMAAGERDLALALAAFALPDTAPRTESQANAALERWLAGPACWLDVDHVELRRWLVDRGLWRRDDWGRDYRRTSAAELDAALRAPVDALAPLDLVTWVAARRDDAERVRARRREAWQSRAGAAPPGGSR